MRVSIIFKSNSVNKKHHLLFLNYIKFLQKEFPLKKDIKIFFLSDRGNMMSTGLCTDNHELYILSKDRLNRDIFRTLAHEWVHEYQLTILGREIGSDIGGKNEDEANAYAGRLVKMFEKEYPDIENKMYE